MNSVAQGLDASCYSKRSMYKVCVYAASFLLGRRVHMIAPKRLVGFSFFRLLLPLLCYFGGSGSVQSSLVKEHALNY